MSRTSRHATADVFYWAMLLSACAMGEAVADFFSHGPLHMGYAKASILLASLVVVALLAERRAHAANETRYWTTIVIMATAGTTIADYLSRTLELGYLWSSVLLGVLFVVTLLLWRWGRARPSSREAGPGEPLFPHVSIPPDADTPLPHVEVSERARTLPTTDGRYWAAIMVASTLGTTLGDALTNGTTLGFGGGTLLLGALLAIVLFVEFRAHVANEPRYWTGLVLASTIGATSGDYLTKQEGLHWGYAGGIGALVALFLVVALIGRGRARSARAR